MSFVIEIIVTRDSMSERVRCVAIERVGVNFPIRFAKIEEILSIVTSGAFILINIKLLESSINCVEKLLAMSEYSIARC